MSELDVTPPENIVTENPTERATMDRAAVARGFVWSSFFSFISKVIFPLAGLLVARRLGPSIFGTFVLIQMTIEISEIIRDAGLTQNYLIEREMDRRKEATYAGLSLIMGLIPAVIVVVLAIPMSRFFHEPAYVWALPLAALCLILNALGTILNARMMRKAEIKELGIIATLGGAISLALTLLLVLAFNLGFVALMAQLVFGSFLNLFLLSRREPFPGLYATKADLTTLFRRSRTLLGANLLNNLFLLSDVFVINRLLGKAGTGFYNTAQNLAYKPFSLITQPLGRTLEIAFSQSAGDLQKLAQAYYRALAAVVLFVLPIYVFMSLGSETIILLLPGPKFSGSIPVLTVLCLYLAFRTLGNISGNALVPAGKHAWTLYPWYGALTITLAGVLWVAPKPTLMGLVWAYVAGAVFVYASVFALAMYFIPGNRELYARVGRAAAVSAVTSIVFLLAFQIPIVHWGRFLIAGLAGLLCHVMLVGRFFGDGPFSLRSKAGLKAVWRRL